MGFFRKDTEEDALKKIENINREMREISASVHLNYNTIDGRNRSKVRNHFDKSSPTFAATNASSPACHRWTRYCSWEPQ